MPVYINPFVPRRSKAPETPELPPEPRKSAEELFEDHRTARLGMVAVALQRTAEGAHDLRNDPVYLAAEQVVSDIDASITEHASEQTS